MGRQGQFKLAVQREQIAYFGVISIDVDLSDDGELTITHKYDDVLQWMDSIRFGFVYAREKLQSLGVVSTDGGLRIKIIDARWAPAIDTTQVIMAYVAAQALFDCFEVAPTPYLSFDDSTGVFGFHK